MMEKDLPQPRYPVVLWVDDNPEVFQFIARRLEGIAEVFKFDDIIEVSDEHFWRYLTELATPALVCVSMHRAPTPNDFKPILDNLHVSGVISDLEIGGNPLAGMVVLSVAASSRFRPQMAVFSGRIDPAIEEVAKALGVVQILSKGRRQHETLLETVFRWLGVEQRYEATRQLMDLNDTVEQLRQENTRLKGERAKLKQEIKNLTKNRPRSSPTSRRVAVTAGDPGLLKEKLADLERQIQLVLAHHHDLTSTSSLTVQVLDHLMSEPRLLPPVISEEIERARISAKHCDVLVSSLATLTTKDINRQKFSPASVDRAINEAIQIIQRKVPETIALTRRVPERLPLCNVPEHLLVRCILNLLLNSIEALPQGGTIDITAKVLSGRVRYVQVQVRDNGKGVKKAELARVFDSDFSTKGKASGLGLFIVRKTLTDFGGSVFVKSERGRGAEVTLRIPIA